MIICKATVADLDVVAPLYDAYRQFYTQPADLAAARAFIGERIGRGESTVFLALDDDAPRTHALGFTQLYPAFCSVAARPYLVLYDLFVATGASRRDGRRSAGAANRSHQSTRPGVVRITGLDPRRAVLYLHASDLRTPLMVRTPPNSVLKAVRKPERHLSRHCRP